MDADFWHRKWAKDEIGFHESEVNLLLLKHFCGPRAGARQQGVRCRCAARPSTYTGCCPRDYRVVGVELSRLAVEQLFAELGIEPAVSACGPFERFSGPGVDVFVGDFFELSVALLGPVDAIYDRAALVALPPAMRQRYAAHLTAITARAPQLLICFEYDPKLMQARRSRSPVKRSHDTTTGATRSTLLDRVEIPGGFRAGFRRRRASGCWLGEWPRARRSPDHACAEMEGLRLKTLRCCSLRMAQAS